MPRPIVCGETNYANANEFCAVPIEWWREETHPGVHGWAREPRQVGSHSEVETRMRERLPNVAAHLDHLRGG